MFTSEKDSLTKVFAHTYGLDTLKNVQVISDETNEMHIDQDVLERTYLERNSYRSTARLFEISHVSVINLIKKSEKFSTV